MELSAAIRAVIATLRRRPDDLLPMYILGLAVPAIVQSMFIITGMVLAGYFHATGRVTALRNELALIDTQPPDPETDPDAFVAWMESLEPAIETLITPTSVGLLIVTGILGLILLFVVSAAVSAGQLGACFARLQQQRGIVRGIGALKRYWLRFVGVYLLEIVLWVVVSVMAVIVIGGATLVSPILGLFVSIFVVLFWAGALIGIRAVFTFAPVAIVVEDRTVLGSVKGSAGFIRAEFMNAVSYYVISIGLLIGVASVASTLAAVGAPNLTPLVSVLLVAPALDLLKTVLFGDFRGAVRPLSPPEYGVGTQIRRGIRRGMGELGRFIKETPGLHVLATGLLGLGIAVGWVAATPFVGIIETSISARTADFFPPIDALNLFGNNWTVAMTMVYAGVAAAIPAGLIVLFNGILIGSIARLEIALIELVAFVIPHGVVEIPALIIAGAAGFYLGIATVRAWRGRVSRRSLAGSFQRMFWVLVGIGVLLAIAGFLEGFVSPYYYHLFL